MLQTMAKVTQDVSEYVTQQVSCGTSPPQDTKYFSPVVSPQSQLLARRESRRDRTTRNKPHKSIDKENQSNSDEGWSYIGSDPEQNSLGLGVDTSRDVGKDVGNIPQSIAPPQRARKEKEKKNRRGLAFTHICKDF
jgi:hypothetical protein